MNAAATWREVFPYSASLVESTQSTRKSAFRAVPPVASPVESMKLDRNALMNTVFLEATSNSYVPPKLSAVGNFQPLLALLPAEMPPTDPYVSQTGSICFDWDFNPRCQLSIILKDKDQIAYAAYFSGERVHGSSRFSSLGLPEGLAAIAKRWIRTSNISS